jgi:flagellin
MQLKGQGVELIINTNLAVLNAYNNLMHNYNSRVKFFERLSSSKRINSTADDPGV